jgi:hypothetical protein
MTGDGPTPAGRNRWYTGLLGVPHEGGNRCYIRGFRLKQALDDELILVG